MGFWSKKVRWGVAYFAPKSYIYSNEGGKVRLFETLEEAEAYAQDSQNRNTVEGFVEGVFRLEYVYKSGPPVPGPSVRERVE